MSDVQLEKRSDGVGLITLDRPESMNTFGGSLLTDLTEALRDCESDPEVGCVALAGNGRMFSAGGDVKGFADAKQSTGPRPEFTALVSGTWRSMMETSGLLHDLAKPTVALIHGAVAGGGLGLALACDLRLVSTKARLVTAFQKVALSGDYGVTYFLPRLIGTPRAKDLLFRGQEIPLDVALELGVVNRIIPHEEFREQALAYCAELAAGPTGAIARMKQNLNLAETADLATVMHQEALNICLSMREPDHHEAAKAFVEKRAPDFRRTKAA